MQKVCCKYCDIVIVWCHVGSLKMVVKYSPRGKSCNFVGVSYASVYCKEGGVSVLIMCGWHYCSKNSKK